MGGDADLRCQIDGREYPGVIAVRRLDGSEITAETPLGEKEHFYVYIMGAFFPGRSVPAGIPAPADPPVKLNGSGRFFFRTRTEGGSGSLLCTLHSLTLAPGLVGVERIEASAGSAAEKRQI